VPIETHVEPDKENTSNETVPTDVTMTILYSVFAATGIVVIADVAEAAVEVTTYQNPALEAWR